MLDTVSFTAMKDGTFEDYEMLGNHEVSYRAGTPDRLLDELARQGSDSLGGYRISRLEHGLQSATRARRDGADLDWVVATLLHDIGDGLAPQNHDRVAAEILRPFVSEEVTWVIEHHGIFQMYYYGHHYGWDRNEYKKHAGNPYYQSCVDFCERWDQCSFDPDYASDSLESFADDVRTVFSRKAFDPDIINTGFALGLPKQEPEMLGSTVRTF